MAILGLWEPARAQNTLKSSSGLPFPRARLLPAQVYYSVQKTRRQGGQEPRTAPGTRQAVPIELLKRRRSAGGWPGRVCTAGVQGRAVPGPGTPPKVTILALLAILAILVILGLLAILAILVIPGFPERVTQASQSGLPRRCTQAVYQAVLSRWCTGGVPGSAVTVVYRQGRDQTG